MEKLLKENVEKNPEKAWVSLSKGSKDSEDRQHPCFALCIRCHQASINS